MFESLNNAGLTGDIEKLKRIVAEAMYIEGIAKLMRNSNSKSKILGACEMIRKIAFGEETNLKKDIVFIREHLSAINAKLSKK